jgi:hypothetical protein
MDAESAGLVGAGRHHTPALGGAADNNRQTAQFGPVELLNRGKKGIHVNVYDLADGRHGKNGFKLEQLSPLTLTAVKAIIRQEHSRLNSRKIP